MGLSMRRQDFGRHVIINGLGRAKIVLTRQPDATQVFIRVFNENGKNVKLLIPKQGLDIIRNFINTEIGKVKK